MQVSSSIFPARVRFGGASPELTSRFYTQLIPGRNDEVVFQIRQTLPGKVSASRGKFDHLFAQDPQWAFEEPGQPLQVKSKSVSEIPDCLEKSNVEPLTSNLYGGNCYLGLRDSGEPFCLVGERVINTSGDSHEEGIAKVAADLDIRNPGHITVIPQLSAWYLNDIDTFIRPVGGNNILVYDPETTREFLQKNNIQRLTPIEGCESASERSYQNIQKLLKDKGFNVIKTPGLFHYEGRMSTGDKTEFDVSLLNGLVHQDPETGKLTYVTMDPAKTDLKNAFSKWLMENCPDIEQIVYVDGGPPLENRAFPNRMVQIFNLEKGGLHCMFGEVINGRIWKEANRKSWNA